jgi:hypothetical protein
MKQDIRQYSDNELSLLVFNDEYLYLRRFRAGFAQMIDEMFEYTSEQLDVLIQDINDEEIS